MTATDTPEHDDPEPDDLDPEPDDLDPEPDDLDPEPDPDARPAWKRLADATPLWRQLADAIAEDLASGEFYLGWGAFMAAIRRYHAGETATRKAFAELARRGLAEHVPSQGWYSPGAWQPDQLWRPGRGRRLTDAEMRAKLAGDAGTEPDVPEPEGDDGTGPTPDQLALLARARAGHVPATVVFEAEFQRGRFSGAFDGAPAQLASALQDVARRVERAPEPDMVEAADRADGAVEYRWHRPDGTTVRLIAWQSASWRSL